jgi:uncharacterized membrane protein YphA (DoxX/SURF4 family)
MKSAVVLVRVATGSFFAVAGMSKLMGLTAFLFAIADFQILPARLIPLVAVAVPGLELALGIALAMGLFSRSMAVALGCLTVLFMIAMSVALARGSIVDCGCFGSIVHARVGLDAMARNTFVLLTCSFLWKKSHHPFSIDSLLTRLAATDQTLSRN